MMLALPIRQPAFKSMHGGRKALAKSSIIPVQLLRFPGGLGPAIGGGCCVPCLLLVCRGRRLDWAALLRWQVIEAYGHVLPAFRHGSYSLWNFARQVMLLAAVLSDVIEFPGAAIETHRFPISLTQRAAGAELEI